MARNLRSSSSRCDLTGEVLSVSIALAPVEHTFKDPEFSHYFETVAILDRITYSEEAFEEEPVAKIPEDSLWSRKDKLNLRVPFVRRRDMDTNHLCLMLSEACRSRIHPGSRHFLPIGQRSAVSSWPNLFMIEAPTTYWLT